MANYTVSSKGTCTPKNKITLLAYMAVQNEANRFQDASGKKLLACDGKIGVNTMAAVNNVANMFPTTGILGAPATSCKHIADQAGSYMLALKNVADQNKLPVPACPKGIIQKITNPAPKVNETTGEVVYPSVATAGFAGIPLWAIALVGAGGYYYFKKTKEGKKQWKSLTGGF